MNLSDKINQDYISAYKSGEELKVSVLRMVKSSIKNEEISIKEELSDDDIIKVLKKEIKQRKDSAEEYRKADTNDKAEKEESEAKLIESYLPNQLSDEEIRQIIKEMIKETGANDISKMGQIIGAVMAKHGTEADGSIVARIAKEELQV